MKSATLTKRYPPGTVLGSYRLEEVIGEGTMGIVYVATHTHLGRRDAIKVLRSEYADNAIALRRFFDEARAVNKISHANVLEVTDFVERPGQDNYYVMEFLEGVTLAELVAVAGMLELPRAVAIMAPLAKALEAVHDAGIVHRDVKPFNIILVHRDGNRDFVKLFDFGSAQLTAEGGRLARDRSETQAVVGTPRYMSPEQAAGGMVDHRTDIYAFGAMLYELVTGRPPISISTDLGMLAETLRTVQPTPPRALPGLPHVIPEALDALIMRCLAKTPAERPARMELVAEKLVAIADEEGWLVYELSAVPPASSAATGPRPRVDPTAIGEVKQPARRGRWLAMLAVAAIAAGGAIFFVTQRAARTAPTKNPAAERRAQIDAELAIADKRIESGRLVGAGGDEALDHLLDARTLDPEHPGVRQRLETLARMFERLAEEARAANSLAEAAAHLETVLVIEPGNPTATARLRDIEQRVLDKQRTNRAP